LYYKEIYVDLIVAKDIYKNKEEEKEKYVIIEDLYEKVRYVLKYGIFKV
jgi:hypothetical protein